MLIVLVVLASLLGSYADDTTTANLLWPKPYSMQFGSNVYQLSPDSFQFTSAGAGANSDVVGGAFARYYRILFQTNAPFYPTGATEDASGTLTKLVATVDSGDETLGPDTDESYELSVTGGQGSLTARTVYGVLRGLETFSQLVYRTPRGGYSINEVTIKDAPRFKFRGTMMDTSRHYISVNTILTHLDAMSYNKMNVFHWHIVDDQSFPYMSVKFPALSEKGAYTQESVYSQENIKMIIAYGKTRGIRVIPEFDTPGHSMSWGKGQPNLLTVCYTEGKPDGTFGPINPILDSTWTFLQDFFLELNQTFEDQYFHLGGDEVGFGCWQSNPDVKIWMSKRNATNYAVLENYYEDRLLSLVNDIGKSYIVWQEIFDNGLKIRQDTVVDVWKGGWQDEMSKITKAGYNVILSNPWYLSSISYGSDWIPRYQADPYDFKVESPDQYKLVMGGEACMWAEYVDSTNFISEFWPRGSAVAERLWSPQDVTDLIDAETRMNNLKCRMMSRGVGAEPVNGPTFCAYEWHPRHDSL